MAGSALFGFGDDNIHAVAAFLAAAAALYLLLAEQLSYRRKKGPLPGPPLVAPFFGSLGSLIRDPTAYWDGLAARARESEQGLAADYFLGTFVVFIRDTELIHRVLGNVRADAFQFIGHAFGKKLFGEHNLIYKVGEEHRELRRRIAPNFTQRALSKYAAIQQRVILAHLRAWLDRKDQSPFPIRDPCRDMNLETSQTAFVGPYLSDEARERFARDYDLLNAGLTAAPVDLPGFAFRRAKRAVARLARTLTECARQSKARMRAGGEPECLVDYWMQDSVKEIDEEVGGHLFDFLYAAQDASTSSLCWAVAILDAHPDVLARVRAEVAAVWSADSAHRPITAEQMAELRYTHAVAREVVRYRPPATMVPHIAKQSFRLTEWYTVPKGATVFPSLLESSFQGFRDPEAFDPDRFFSESRREDVSCNRNFLPFGVGAHQCVGQRYALNHLVLFIALFVSVMNFTRYKTKGCDDFVYIPTIAPKDGCAVYLHQRCAKLPSF
ncbi:hypothetical protein PR202_ga25672 [Eleusine coracana subsp. coracana]|uniref:sterol 22-desaturase n=1 Tax=Eleusine coracana subsp. coracana TaxID=191504 RepID=A0AAV5DC97_ELECO|nr:hypothetical protein QOZ80_3AG0249200 [Eleusine coracana subsp. coracana]GJN07808.1 hypothetical protein PR202_ga25672 [Eleusine coracana subsp. coracana]